MEKKQTWESSFLILSPEFKARSYPLGEHFSILNHRDSFLLCRMSPIFSRKWRSNLLGYLAWGNICGHQGCTLHIFSGYYSQTTMGTVSLELYNVMILVWTFLILANKACTWISILYLVTEWQCGKLLRSQAWREDSGMQNERLYISSFGSVIFFSSRFSFLIMLGLAHAKSIWIWNSLRT